MIEIDQIGAVVAAADTAVVAGNTAVAVIAAGTAAAVAMVDDEGMTDPRKGFARSFSRAVVAVPASWGIHRTNP